MVKRSHGPRQGTRKKLSRRKRERGLSPISRHLQRFETGDKVNVIIDPSVHNGQPHHRFHGHTGEIIGTQGTSYVIKIIDGKKQKLLLVAPAHLRPFSGERRTENIWRKRERKHHEPKTKKTPMWKIRAIERARDLESEEGLKKGEGEKDVEKNVELMEIVEEKSPEDAKKTDESVSEDDGKSAGKKKKDTVKDGEGGEDNKKEKKEGDEESVDGDEEKEAESLELLEDEDREKAVEKDDPSEGEGEKEGGSADKEADDKGEDEVLDTFELFEDDEPVFEIIEE